MAIRERKGRKSPWQVYWNNPFTGKRESQDFLTKQAAEKEDSLVKHRLKFDRESFKKDENEVEADTENEHNVMTLEACYLMYLNQKQFNKKGIEWQMDSMRYPLIKLGSIPVGEITKKHIEQIMGDMLQTKVKPISVRVRLSVLRTVIRWCADNGFRGPVEFPKLPPAHYEKFIPPTTVELRAIMENASPHIVRSVIIGSQLGVRVGPCELLKLTWNDVDFENRLLRVHGSKKHLGFLWREVPIRENLLPLFEEWKRDDDLLGARFIIHYKGRQVSDVHKEWGATLRRAGITRRIRPYDLRHAFATEAIAAGADYYRGSANLRMGMVP